MLHHRASPPFLARYRSCSPMLPATLPLPQRRPLPCSCTTSPLLRGWHWRSLFSSPHRALGHNTMPLHLFTVTFAARCPGMPSRQVMTRTAPPPPSAQPAPQRLSSASAILTPPRAHSARVRLGPPLLRGRSSTTAVPSSAGSRPPTGVLLSVLCLGGGRDGPCGKNKTVPGSPM